MEADHPGNGVRIARLFTAITATARKLLIVLNAMRANGADYRHHAA